ncbi:hypothetical protein GE061_003649 [Apolygus lucorum]|uniref:Uncharacterized protein n=1 Tax=Apolygus lucorum TaxID=248454 RepID=A0A6A4JLP2_APOLU|nr:hypothetical protein GE061_003649 [Apolygus lucorum]
MGDNTATDSEMVSQSEMESELPSTGEEAYLEEQLEEGPSGDVTSMTQPTIETKSPTIEEGEIPSVMSSATAVPQPSVSTIKDPSPTASIRKVQDTTGTELESSQAIVAEQKSDGDILKGPSANTLKASSGVALGSADKMQLQTMLDNLMSEAEELAQHSSRSVFTVSELGLKGKHAGKTAIKSESYQQLKTIYEPEESEYASKMPSVMELFAAGIETSLTLNDFAWPRFAMDEPDQVYENLLAMTVINPELCVMHGERVIMRKTHNETMVHKVKIITGGIAGNEPLFSGYVGKGMATAAVIGDRKNAPKSLTIYKTIKELALHHDAGILMIIPNKTDYRIAFGLAMERARSEGHLVDMIVFSDDCCDHVETKSGRRCLPGFVMVLKVAGAMSEDERTMKEIYLTVQSLLIVTISAHVNDWNVFVGTGINDGGFEIKCVCNENDQDCEKQPTRGCATRTHNKLRNIVETMMDFATGYKRYFALPLKPFAQVVVLINSYTEDKLFLYSVVAEVLRQLYCQDVVANRIYAGTFVSSRRGFSISLLKVFDEEVLHWLDYATSVDAWPTTRMPSSIPIVTKSIYEMPVYGQRREFGPTFDNRQQILLPFLIATVMEDLSITEAILNELDPSKTYGTCLVSGCKGVGIANKSQQLNFTRPYNLLHQIAMIIEDKSYGITGSLLALFVGSMANEFLKFSEGTRLEYKMLGSALISAAETIRTYAKINSQNESYIGDVCIPAGVFLMEVPPEVPAEEVMETLFKLVKSNIASSRHKPFGRHAKGREECGCVSFLFVIQSLMRARKKVAF